LRFFRSEYTELLQPDIHGGPNGNGNGTKEALAPTI